MMLLIDIFALLNPQLIRWAIDNGIEGGDTQLLLIAVLALLLIVVVKGVFTYFEGIWTEVASQNVAYDLRNALQRKITLLSFSFHDQAEAGDLLSRTIQDVERIRFLTGRAMFRIIEGVFLLLITAVALIWMNPRLGLLAIAAMPLLVVQSIRFGRRYRPLSMLIQKQLGTLTTRLEQNLRGARVVKTFAQEDAEIERFARENDYWFDLSAEAARLQSFNIPILQLVANLSTVIILFTAACSSSRVG
jgi:ATP-binding cassette subfamily B protein